MLTFYRSTLKSSIRRVAFDPQARALGAENVGGGRSVGTSNSRHHRHRANHASEPPRTFHEENPHPIRACRFTGRAIYIATNLLARHGPQLPKPRLFFRPTSPKNCTVEFTLPVEIVRKLQRLALRGRRSERNLCQDVLRAFTNTVFTGASFQQFHSLVNAKVTKPAFITLQDEADLLTLEIAEHYRKKGNRPLPRRLAKAGMLIKAAAWDWAKNKPKDFWVHA